MAQKIHTNKILNFDQLENDYDSEWEKEAGLGYVHRRRVSLRLCFRWSELSERNYYFGNTPFCVSLCLKSMKEKTIYLFFHFGHEEELGQGAFAFHYQMNIDK